MLRDILESKMFLGRKYRFIADSLGQPELWAEAKANELWYSVRIDHASDDPSYTKHLVLTMDNDSTIAKVETREHDHRRIID